ncbi:hypothetical protein M3Y99_00584700 [Aphelenchoides fujianensis]|nr:hypothetical protein M3Y99_00584700 [Aphelenchoides fujianensis]
MISTKALLFASFVALTAANPIVDGDHPEPPHKPDGGELPQLQTRPFPAPASAPAQGDEHRQLPPFEPLGGPLDPSIPVEPLPLPLPHGTGPLLPPFRAPFKAMAQDVAMMDGFDFSKFLCASCRSMVDIGKHYLQNDKGNTQGLNDFFHEQHYFEDFQDSCRHEFAKSGAKAGKFFACNTLLVNHLNEVQQHIQQKGVDLLKEKNELCFEQGMKLCKSGLLASITGK